MADARRPELCRRTATRTLWKLKIRSNSHTLPKYLSSTCIAHGLAGSAVVLWFEGCNLVRPRRRSRCAYLNEVVDDFQRDQLVVALLDARNEVQASIPLVYKLRSERHRVSGVLRPV